MTALQRVAQVKQEYQQAGHPVRRPFLLAGRRRDDPWVSYTAIATTPRPPARHRPRFLKLLDYFRDIGPDQYCWQHLTSSPQHGQLRAGTRPGIIGNTRATRCRRLPEHLLMARTRTDALELDYKMARLPGWRRRAVYYSATDGALSNQRRDQGQPRSPRQHRRAPSPICRTRSRW